MPYAEPSNFQFVLLTVCPDSHRAIMSDPEGPNTTPIEALNAQHFYDSCLSLSLDRFPFELGQKEAEDRESLRTDVIEAGVGTLLSAVLGGLLGGAAGGPPGAATGAILAGGSAAQISIFIVGFRHAWDSLQTYRWTLQHGCALFDQERECYEQTQEVGVFDPTDAAEVVRAPDDILDRFNSLGISSFVIQATCPAG